MGKMKDIVIELGLTPEQCKDKEISKFALQVGYRKQTGDWYQYWDGNGYCEINKKNGTMITTVLTDEEFKPDFPLNIDMNISTVCTNSCPFCYEGCSANGKHADIKKYINDKNSFLYSIHEGTELALNGNEPLHPDLELLLKFCKERNILANLTVNENTLILHKSKIKWFLEEGLIHGIGISPTKYSYEMIEFCRDYPTAVIHTIAGITSPEQYEYMKDRGLKILILGYKTFGRGIQYSTKYDNEIINNINMLRDNCLDIIKHFKLVSFDNLAIEQLDVKNKLNEKDWSKFYRGDDGHHTFYVDLVEEKFAKNSIQPRENRQDLLDNVNTMLKIIQKGV